MRTDKHQIRTDNRQPVRTDKDHFVPTNQRQIEFPPEERR
jgi:hypothetical protein